MRDNPLPRSRLAPTAIDEQAMLLPQRRSGLRSAVLGAVAGLSVAGVAGLFLMDPFAGDAESPAIEVSSPADLPVRTAAAAPVLPPGGEFDRENTTASITVPPLKDRSRLSQTAPDPVPPSPATARIEESSGASPAPAAPAPAAPPAARPAAAPLLSPSEVETHLARAEEKLKTGDLATARLFFERVAEAGDARGAAGMARSFDPEVLRDLPVFGMRPNAEEAARWYARAKELGTVAAAR